jgi:hypothetical protein
MDIQYHQKIKKYIPYVLVFFLFFQPGCSLLKKSDQESKPEEQSKKLQNN